MAQAIILPKGHKKALVRQCLNELGVGASLGKAKKWFMRNHKLTLADATFYHVRQDMQREKIAVPTYPVVSVPQKLPTIHEKISGVVDLVKTAKELVDKLGKEEVRKLIDLL